MAYDASKAKSGDRVLDESTGQEWLFNGSDWEPVVVDAPGAAAIGVIDKGIRNVLNAPSAIEQTIDATAQFAATGADALTQIGANVARGKPPSIFDEFQSSARRMAESPAAEGTIPRFGDYRNIGEDVRTGVRAGAGMFAPNIFPQLGMDEARAIEQQRADQARQIHPFAIGAGEFGADAAAIVLGRKPARMARQQVAQRNAESAKALSRELNKADPGIRAAYEDEFTKMVRAVERGKENIQTATIKIGEAGVEGAFLAALNNDDPVISAAANAGLQSAGSLGLFLSTKPRKALVPFALSAFAGHELFKVFAPGPTDFFGSEDFAFRAAALALTMGAVGAVAGSGRAGPGLLQYPGWGDAITSIPRAAWENRMREFREYQENGDPLPLQVLGQIGSDPQFFNDDQLRSLERAYKSPKKDAFGKEVRRLMRDSAGFRSRIADMQDRRTPPAGTTFSGSSDPERTLRFGTPTQPIQRQ